MLLRTAEMSYYLEHNVPIVSDFIRLNLRGSEPFLKGKGIITGKRGPHQAPWTIRPYDDDYLPVYDRFDRQQKVSTQQQIDEQRMIRLILENPTAQRSNYMGALIGQLGDLINEKVATVLNGR